MYHTSVLSAERAKTSRTSLRALFGVCIITIVILLSMLFASTPKITFAENESVRVYTSVMIEEGDTLWDIAVRYAVPGQNVSTFVSEIKDVNGLKTDRIYSGNYLIVPVYR